MQFLATKNHLGNYKLLVNGESFGTIYLDQGKVTGGFFRDEAVKECHRRLCLTGMPRETLADNLAICRRAYEIVAEDYLAVDHWQQALEEGRR